jgi:hypothetical protein
MRVPYPLIHSDLIDFRTRFHGSIRRRFARPVPVVGPFMLVPASELALSKLDLPLSFGADALVEESDPTE